jgi:hypothetical protein
MAARTKVLRYQTNRIEDFHYDAWGRFAEEHGWLGMGAHCMGARNLGTKKWLDPDLFSHGKGCKDRVQQAMKDGAVELKIGYAGV